MASFIRNTFDNLVNNISSTLDYPNSHRSSRSQSTNSNNNTNSRTSRRRANDRPPNISTSPVRRNIPPYHQTANRSNECSSRTRQQASTGNQQSNRQQQQREMNINSSSYTANDDKLDIGDVRDLNDINKLSAKQLKIILTRNCIDYKGVFEKEVLREKVMQLWIDCNQRKDRSRRIHAQNQARHATDEANEHSDDIDDSQTCKICMEREINCVLLECGHMLSCVTCGRKLAECPICRQNVTRCVRTFKG